MSEVVHTNEPYFDGMLDVYAASMLNEDTPTSAASYEDFQLMGLGISVKITPKYKEGTRYASNKKVRNKKVLEGYEVELGLDKIRAAIRSKMDGRERDANGVELLGATNPKPMAIAFSLSLDDGSCELWQLYKGTFETVTVEGKTAEDKFEYQDHVAKAFFDRRLNDNRLGAVVEDNDSAVPADVIKNWFTKVYEPADAAAPEGDNGEEGNGEDTQTA